METKIEIIIKSTENEPLSPYEWWSYDVEGCTRQCYYDLDDLKKDFRNELSMDVPGYNVEAPSFEYLWEQVEELKPEHILSFQTVQHCDIDTENPFDIPQEWAIKRNY